MTKYNPNLDSVNIYEEDGYRISAVNSHLTIHRGIYWRASAGLMIEEIPDSLKQRLIKKGYNPEDFIYVPYILIKAAAKKEIEEYIESLKEYQRSHYVRALLR